MTAHGNTRLREWLLCFWWFAVTRGLDQWDSRSYDRTRVKPSMLMDYKLRSPLLPGGDLVSAVLNRQVMGLADRGGASGLVGRRWADLCSEWADELVGRDSHVPVPETESFSIQRVARLDHVPRIAAIASKKGLQNPDIVIIGHRNGRSVVQAADAKFSVETARSKQVSPGVVEALLGLGAVVRSVTGELTPEIEYVPGVFLSPDYPLTHLMLQGRHGITRATVRSSEVVFVPVDPARFFEGMPAFSLMHVLAGVDVLDVSIEQSLLAGLYYFRLSRAVVASWLDSVKPLLLLNDRVEVDESAILQEASNRVAGARSAFDLMLAWDVDVEAIRAKRTAVDQVTSLPVVTRDLRNAIAAVVGSNGEHGPSVSQVRRRLGAWYRSEIRAVVGPIPPSEPDFAGRLQELGSVSAGIARAIPTELNRIVRELIEEKANEVHSLDISNDDSCAIESV